MRAVLFTGDIFRQQTRGGITRYFVEVARRLRRPHAILAGVHRCAALDGLAHARGVRVPVVPGGIRLAAPFNAAFDRIELGRAEARAIVHPTYYRPVGSLPRRATLVLTVHDMTHERFPALGRRPWWRTADPARHKAALCARAERIVCYSESVKADAVAMLGIPCERVRVVPLAASGLRDVAPRPVPGLAAPFVLWVGERHAYKNFDRGLEAWARCGEATGTRLVCVGGAAFTEVEHAAMARLGVGARVERRTLEDAELRWAYEHASALLYPSRSEGFGLPVLEAMTLGCPVAAARATSLPEVGGDAVFYGDPDDADSLADALAQALGSGRDAARVARAQTRAATFSWERTAAAHDALYDELDP